MKSVFCQGETVAENSSIDVEAYYERGNPSQV